jgi:hypothetical protein
MSRSLLLAALLGSGLLAAPASAATFEVVSGSGIRATGVSFSGPIGQSFTSVDSVLTSIGFQFNSLNPGSPNSPVTFTLREGEGLNGAVLFTGSFTLPTTINSRTPVWYDFALPNVAVTAGSLYTALVSTTSSRLALVYGPDVAIGGPNNGQPLSSDAYLPGQLIAIGSTGGAICQGDASICDANFRVSGVTPPAAAVPEPATWAMMIGGFGLVGGALRRRRTGTVFA